MSEAREMEIQRAVWELLAELRGLHAERTGHTVWTHRRVLDVASRCFVCTVPNYVEGSLASARELLGERCVDTASGFIGIATAVAYYLGDEVKVQLTRIGKEDKPVEVWFARARLTEAASELPGNHI